MVHELFFIPRSSTLQAPSSSRDFSLPSDFEDCRIQSKARLEIEILGICLLQVKGTSPAGRFEKLRKKNVNDAYRSWVIIDFQLPRIMLHLIGSEDAWSLHIHAKTKISSTIMASWGDCCIVFGSFGSFFSAGTSHLLPF